MIVAKYFIPLFAVLCISMQMVQSYNILVMTPLGSRSHKIYFMGIVNALLDNGHHVTIVSGDANSKPVKNLKDVVVINAISAVTKKVNIFEEGGSDKMMMTLMQNAPELCVKGLASEQVQDLKKDKYDVVIISIFVSDCYLSLVDHMKIPFIYLSPAGLISPFAAATGQIDMPSIVPNKMMTALFPFTFIQRLQSTFLNYALVGVMNLYLKPKMIAVCKREGLCRPDMPSIDEFNKNVSLTIINEIRSLESPIRPMMQNIIYAGGAHIKPGKPLSKDLEDWVQGSGDAGFIYFSLGSACNPTDMPERHRLAILNVFGNLKQRVLWKWNAGSMENLPPNVRVEKWLPQPDLLAHSKIRMFISHGGLLSTMESTYFGVPLLGMPLMGDQYVNMEEATINGYAKMLDWKDLTEESLANAINNILMDKELKKVSEIRSKHMRDVPTDPAKDAAFWVEYVVRNKGAPHLRSPIHQLSWIELNNVDVYAFLFGMVLIFLCVVYKTLKFLVCICFGNKTNKKSKKNKKD